MIGCEADRVTLTALYDATEGATWRNKDNWKSKKPLNTWYSVTTNAKGCVIGLFLAENNLKGFIPAELGSLTQLEYLNLSDNQLSGTIPVELGNVNKLIALDLGDNSDLTGLLPGN